MDDDERYPAYVHNTWHTGITTKGPQCSASGNWCFMCSCAAGGENNPLDNIKSMIRIMIDQHKELPTIVLAVEEVYNATARPQCSYKTDGGQLIEAPAWSKNSIATHLICSTEFPELHHNVVVQVYQSMLATLNNHMLTADGNLDDAKRKAYIETATALAKWNGGPPKRVKL